MVKNFVSAISYFVTIFLILNGCSHTMRNNYPNWPPITKISKDSISFIAGKYHAKSAPHQQLKGYSRSLLSYLTEDKIIINNFTSMSIYIENDKHNHHIKVEVLQGESVVNEFKLKKEEDFVLTNNGIQIFRDWHFVNINFGLAWEKNYYIFNRAIDGSLILKNMTFIKGLFFFIIPVYSEEVFWWRWLPIVN